MITAYVGENDGERLATVRRFVAEFEKQYGDMAVEKLDADEVSYDRLSEAVQSVPFLCERKLVVVRGGSLNKDFTERVEDFLQAINESTDVLLTEGKVDKRTSFYKLLQKKTVFKDFAILDANGLARFAAEYAKAHGGSLSAGDARLLVERSGLNQEGLRNELEKLLAYDTHITRNTIELLTERQPQSRVFDLLDAVFRGDTKRTLDLYADQRAQQVEPQQIIAMLVWQLYIFSLVKVGQGKSAAEIAKAAKLSPFAVEKSVTVMRKVSFAELKGMVTRLRELDVRSKSENILLDDALQHYLLSISAV